MKQCLDLPKVDSSRESIFPSFVLKSDKEEDKNYCKTGLAPVVSSTITTDSNGFTSEIGEIFLLAGLYLYCSNLYSLHQ